MKKHNVEVEFVNRDGGNVFMSLIQENARAMQDAGVIKAGDLVFSTAKKSMPKDMVFFTDSPLGRLISAGLVCVGVNMYNNRQAGGIASAMMASAMNGFIGMLENKVVEETCSRLEKLHAERTDTSDLSGKLTAESNRIDGENGNDTRFSATIGETQGAEVKAAEVKAVAEAAVASNYWPAKQSDLIEQGGKVKCGICGKFVKRNKLGLVTPPGKTEVLACGECRQSIAKTVSKAKAEADAIEKVKKEEAAYHDLKTEITAQEAQVEKLDKKLSSYEAMMKADPEDEMAKGAYDTAKKVLEKANDILADMYGKAEAYEKKAGLSTPKPQQATVPAGKAGVLGKLDAAAKK